jgi:DeoR family transcriptional regulator, fructose operon transcriptional repressor
MLLDERRTQILKYIEQQGFVSLQQLGDHFGISESTARRDVEYLDGISKVQKTRGGAAYIGESMTSFEDRTVAALKEKKEIAQAVAAMVESGEVVLLDGGTTTLEVARQLIGRSLTVVTNSVPIINLLINQPGIELISIGGYVYPQTGVALGPIAQAALKAVHARRLIMSVGGITEAGLFNSNSLLVETERQMMASADEVWVVTDSGKFGRSALAHLAPLDSMDRLITDDGLDPEWRLRLQDAGVEVVEVEGRGTRVEGQLGRETSVKGREPEIAVALDS